MTESLYPSIFAIISTVTGVGVLMIPWSFSQFGVVLATVVTLISLSLIIFTLYCMTWTSERTQLYSFKTIAEAVFGRRIALTLAMIIPIYCVLLLSGYTVLIGDISSSLASELTGVDTNTTWYTDRRLLTAVLLYFIVFPLASQPTLHALRHFSVLSLLAVIYLTSLTLITALSKLFGNPIYEVPHQVDYSIFRFTPNSFTAFSTISLAFACQLTIPSIFKELKPRNAKTMIKVINTSLSIVGGSYLVLCLSSYYLYGDNITENILLSLDKNSGFVSVINFLFLSVILVVYGVLFSGIRDSLTDLYIDFKLKKPITIPDRSIPESIDVTVAESEIASDFSTISRRSSVADVKSMDEQYSEDSDDSKKSKAFSRTSSIASLVSMASRKLSSLSRRSSAVESPEVALNLLSSDNDLDTNTLDLPSVPAPRSTLASIQEHELEDRLGVSRRGTPELSSAHEKGGVTEICLSKGYRRLAAFSCVSMTFGVSILTTSIASVFGLASSSFGMVLVFFFPIGSYWVACKDRISSFQKFLCFVCVGLGVFMTVFGTWSSIRSF
ncbi:hypothetical protein P9112_001903 [Eukaryota sp. TZLM1-RC]